VPTPIVADPSAISGNTLTVTGANAIATGAYSNVADSMRIQRSALTANYLLADFRLTFTFATAPVAGSIQLIKSPRDFSGNRGFTPASTLLGTQVFTFGPLPQASNAATAFVFSLDAVPLDYDADYWLFNNGTGQSIPVGYVLTALPWSPGT
jgi:hypothetical protein